MPTSFNFPNIGKLLALFFVLFAAWFVGRSIPLSDYPGFSVLGLFTLFGGVDLALPFLLDQMRVPSDMYNLYIVTGGLNSWFATLLAVMNLFSFTLVAACAASGSLVLQAGRIFRFAAVSVGVLFVAILGTRGLLTVLVSDVDVERQTLMQSQIEEGPSSNLEEAISETEGDGGSLLQAIRRRGKLLVGYYGEGLPFSFYNDNGELVGMEVEMTRRLARDLGVGIEFVPWAYKTLYDDLGQGKFDVAIGGLAVTPQRLARARFSEPYMDITAGVLVKDYRRREFES